MKTSILTLVVVHLALLYAPNAAAGKPQSGVKCKAYSIVAKEKKGTLPAALKRFTHIFKKMPFKVFGSFELNSQSSMELTAKASQARLSKRLVLKVKLLDRILSAKNKRRYRIQLQIQRKNRKNKKKLSTVYSMIMKLTSGKPMFIAGPKEGGGTLVVGLICK